MSKGDHLKVAVPQDLLAGAREKAAAEGFSLGEIVRGFLRLWLDDLVPTPLAPPKGLLKFKPLLPELNQEELVAVIAYTEAQQAALDTATAMLHRRMVENRRYLAAIKEHLETLLAEGEA
ncbi:MAG: hypothetical protein JXA37_12060 [Chloroflexia bacterium]|nr:hypothetical protein [Chloroflexia bacterium]